MIPMEISQPSPRAQVLSEHFSPPAIVRRVLPNGLIVLVERDPSHPLVAFHAVVKTGSATEGSFLGTGISHVLEHMLFKGTARRPVGAVEKEARSYGGTSQGFTTYDTTSYQLVANKEFWSQAADLLIDALFFPSMDPEEFVKEKGVVLRELRMGKDDPSHRAWELLFENAYRVHPYHIPIIGYEPLLRGLTREDALLYHRRHYHPNAMVIAVAGDVEPQDVIDRIEVLTRSIAPGTVPSVSLPVEPETLSPREVTEEYAVAHAVVTVGFPGISLTDPNLYAADLLAWLLGGDRGARLDRALRETGLVHAVSASNYTPFYPGLFVVSMRLDEEKRSSALEILWRECKRAAEELFLPEEIEQGKRALVREYLESRQTVGAQASDLAIYEALAGDPTFASRYIEQILRVSPDDIQRVAGTFLRPERSTLVTLLPQGATSLKKQVPVSAPRVAPTERIILDNGLRVLLKEDHRHPLVSLQVSFLGGVRYETKENNGISLLLSRMFLRGTRRKKASLLVDEMRHLGAAIEPAAGRNSIGLSAEATGSQLAQLLPLVAELLLESTFPLEEFAKEKTIVLAQLAAREEDPFAFGMKRLMDLLFTQHPYRLDPYGDATALGRLRREDLVAFYGQVLDPKTMVVSLVGDFRKEEALSLLTASFGKWAPKKWPKPAILPEPSLAHLKEHEEVTSRKEALVMIGFPGVALSDSRLITADLAETLLSGGAGRLFTEVREKRGLAYTVGAFALHGLEPGAFILYAITEASQSAQVRQVLLSEVRRLRDEPVSEEEFRVARQGLLGARRIARQTLGAQAAQGALDELYGLGYDFSQRYEEEVQAATVQTFEREIRELLDPQRCVIFVGIPKETPAVSAGLSATERGGSATNSGGDNSPVAEGVAYRKGISSSSHGGA